MTLYIGSNINQERNESKQERQNSSMSQRIFLLEKVGRKQRLPTHDPFFLNPKRFCLNRNALLQYLPLPSRCRNLTKKKLSRIAEIMKEKFHDSPGILDVEWPSEQNDQKEIIYTLSNIHTRFGEPPISEDSASDS